MNRRKFKLTDKKLQQEANEGTYRVKLLYGIFLYNHAYEFGGGDQGHCESLDWIYQAGKTGSTGCRLTAGQYLIGDVSFDEDPPEDEETNSRLKEAFAWLDQAIEDGETAPLRLLGALYGEGEIIEKDLEKSFRYYSLLAETGDPEAIFESAINYLNGSGVEEDLEKGQALLLEAAELGDVVALPVLSYCYEKGAWGFPKDNEKSIYWQE